MKVRYRSSGLKKFTFQGKNYLFPNDRWLEIDSLALYKELRKYPDVFELVNFFDETPFYKFQDHIRFKGNLILTSHSLTARALEKMRHVSLQAHKKELREYVFRIERYDASDLRKFVGTTKIIKIAIYRSQGGIGDVIMTLPVVEKIRQKFPRSDLTYSCPSSILELIKGNPYIDNFAPWPLSVKNANYDMVLDLSRDCIKYEIANQPNVEFNRSEIFLRSCGLYDEKTPRPKLFLNEEEIVWARDCLKEVKGLKVGLVLTANAPVRNWPYFNELRELIDTNYKASFVEISAEKPKKWISLKNSFGVFGYNLRQVASIVNECDIVISPDTGIAHIASALNIPALWIFTHINGRVRTRNYENVSFIQRIPKACPKKQPCWYEIPCGLNGLREKMENPVCALAISPEDVFVTFEKIVKKPNISYVIIYYNGIDYTKECLRRILEVKKYSDELILLDNGSEEKGVFDYLKDSINNLKLLRSEKNEGCIKGRNKALKKVSGTYTLFLDNDQWVSPDSIHRLMSVQADLIGTEAWSMDNSGYAHKIEKGKGPLVYVGAGGLLGKTSLFKKLKGFDEIYHPAWFEDPDLCLRARDQGYSINYHSDPKIKHLAHKTVNEQNDFNPNEVWKKSHRSFMNRWRGRINRLCVDMYADVIGWAWENKIFEIQSFLRNEIDIRLKYLSFDSYLNSSPDLIFTFDCSPGAIRSLISSGRRYLTGVTAHVYQNYSDWKENLQKAIAIHANSLLLYNEICNLNENCYYLPNGVNENLFEYSERDLNDSFKIGYVGKPNKLKGLEEFIMPACKKAEVELVTQSCYFNSKEKLPYQKMPEYYRGIDAVIIASISDGTPNMLLEAASVGRTFVGNRIGNIPEFVEEGKNGFMVNERSIDDYVDRLVWMKRNREEVKRMGIEVRKTIEKGWTWKIQSENYRKMFKKVIIL